MSQEIVVTSIVTYEGFPESCNSSHSSVNFIALIENFLSRMSSSIRYRVIYNKWSHVTVRKYNGKGIMNNYGEIQESLFIKTISYDFGVLNVKVEEIWINWKGA